MSSQAGPLIRLRRGHTELVLELLGKHGPLSRSSLGSLSGLSRTTLYEIVAELISTGAVVASPAEPAQRKRGRPVEKLTLNPRAGQVIGIDFARRAVHVAAVNVAHEVIGTASEAHPAGLPWKQRVDLAGHLVDSLAGGALDLGALTALGVGVVGPVFNPGDEATPAHGVDDLPILLREHFQVPVVIDNNTRLAALAEATWGSAAGSREVVYLRLSYGVGGGLVFGGSLHRGPQGLSGEFGHIRVIEDGKPCECGGTGCLETVASAGAVLDAYRAAGGAADDVPALTSALRDGDETARELLGEVGARVGDVLAGLCNAVGPGLVVIGGELADTGPALLEPLEDVLRARVMPISRNWVGLRPAMLGDTAGALGAIALVLHESPVLSRYPKTSTSKEDA
ncbi:putative NBD/HSP70 family sugar kinase [Lipingzhangella halophila]|uniref:Putative NBD/HSP70 family sugar kinase n=1 Tax=Lipingzhangella halophila TaxID=1783352 RepID=A0A7W7W3P7_9ACTN|nr:ROK family protein [Lipingzhangella halophila]MBB4931935.1 putative NBD/HSP70 family sugar kinase [Lipingzhangella halophila]